MTFRTRFQSYPVIMIIIMRWSLLHVAQSVLGAIALKPILYTTSTSSLFILQ